MGHPGRNPPVPLSAHPSALRGFTGAVLVTLALFTEAASAPAERYYGAETADTADRLGLLIGEWMREPSPGRRWVHCVIETPGRRRIQLQRFDQTFLLVIPTLDRVGNLGPSDAKFVSARADPEPDLPVTYRLPEATVRRVVAWLEARRIFPSAVREIRRRPDGEPDAFRTSLLWIGGSSALLHDFDFGRLLSEALEEPPPYSFRAEKPPPKVDAREAVEPLAPAEAIALAALAPTEGVFRFTVVAQGQDERRIYLNSELDYRLPTCLTVAIDRKLEGDLRRLSGAGNGSLVGQTIRVAGTVARIRIYHVDEKRRPLDRYYYQTHVAVVSAAQLTVEAN